MKKIFLFLFFLISIFLPNTYAISRGEVSSLTIISREQWGADENYTYISSSYWKDIFKKRKLAPVKPLSEEKRKKQAEDHKRKIDFINENFAKQNTLTEKITHEGEEKLAWRIGKSDYVNAIVVHHTHSEYSDSFEGVRAIYKYHSLNREWGDIGYNYIIGYDGEIFEGKKGGDYVVGAHSKWNNISTVGIAIMGNYEKKGINSLQYTSLEKLIQSLSKKYGIDLSKKYYYNMDCSGAACRTFPLETHLKKVLSGHRDTGHTTCPGDKLYKQIEEIRLKNIEFTANFTAIKRESDTKKKGEKVSLSNQKIVQRLKKVPQKKLENLVILLEKRIKQEKNTKKIKKLQIIKIIVKEILKS